MLNKTIVENQMLGILLAIQENQTTVKLNI